MKKQRHFAGNIPGVLAMALFALALALLLGTGCATQQVGTATTSQVSPTPLMVVLEASPTPIPPTATPTQEMTFYSPIDTPTVEPTPTEEKPTPTPVPTLTPMPPFRAENLKVLKETRIIYENTSGGYAWSPDSTQIAFTLGIVAPSGAVTKVGVWVADTERGTLRKLADDVCCPSWSPDGEKIAYTYTTNETRELWVMTADGREQRKLADAHFWFWYVFWKDNEVVSVNEDSHLIFINSDNHQTKVIDKAYPGLAEAVKWRTIRLSPDGTRFAYKYDTSQRIRIVDIASGEQVELVAEEHFAFGPMAWSPDGRRLAYDTSYGPQPSLWVVNADGTEKRQILEWPQGKIGSFKDIAWSPDGNVLAFTYCPTGTYPAVKGCTVYVINVDGTGLRPLEGLDDILGGTLLWSPDGAKMAFSRTEETTGNFNLWVVDIER